MRWVTNRWRSFCIWLFSGRCDGCGKRFSLRSPPTFEFRDAGYYHLLEGCAELRDAELRLGSRSRPASTRPGLFGRAWEMLVVTKYAWFPASTEAPRCRPGDEKGYRGRPPWAPSQADRGSAKIDP